MSRRIIPVITIVALAMAALVFLAPQPTYAHGAGLTFTSTTTDYMVDVDYSAFNIFAGKTGRFDFKLFKDAERTQPADFTRVWVRINKTDSVRSEAPFDIKFSGWVAKADFGSTGISIAIPESGSYEMQVVYNSSDTKIVEATLPFTVEVDKDKRSMIDSQFWAGAATGALLIAAISGITQYVRITRRRR